LASPLFAEFDLAHLSLADAEQIALAQNKELRIVSEESEQADERRKQAISRWLPSIQYRASFQTANADELFFDLFQRATTISHRGYLSILQLDQPLFSTDLVFGLRAKQFEAKAFLLEKAATQNELLLAVRRSYYAVLMYQLALDIERENIDYFSYALKQEQGQLEAGSSTPFEVNQNKVAVANAITKYYLTLKELKNARHALILTLGIDPLLEPEIELAERELPIRLIPEIALKMEALERGYLYDADVLEQTPAATYLGPIGRLEGARQLILFSPESQEEYLTQALELRPELRQHKELARKAEEELKSKQGRYFPEIGGFVRYSYNDTYPGIDPFFNQRYHWIGGLSLSWNVFDGFLREHEIREARSQKRESRIRVDKTWQRVEVEVRNGLYQFEEALLAYVSANQAVLLAEQAREQAADKLRFGRIPPLEYRDSVNQLAQAKNQRNRAGFDLIAAYYVLRYATGKDAY
jgi:outer membrane protein TolC